jgi:hypothetical protein
MVPIFFLLRNEFVNIDASMFTGKFMSAIPLKGSFVTHDEMWEFYLHSRFWYYTDLWFNWSVKLSYQVLSSVAGGVYIFVLLRLCKILFPQKPLTFFWLSVCGGYMQLFFGDMENYTLTAVWIVAYFYLSALHLKGKRSIVMPSLALAIAISFHLLSCFLLPSLIYLFFKTWRGKEYRSFIVALTSFASVIIFTLIFFHFNGLPIRELWSNTHAFGHGGNVLKNLARPSLNYYFDIINLLFLLVPCWILLLPLVVNKEIGSDPLNVHLLISTGAMLLFVFFYRAALGVQQDWNLYANAAIPVSLLVWRNVLFSKSAKKRQWIIFGLGGLFFSHSCAWIIANHNI